MIAMASLLSVLLLADASDAATGVRARLVEGGISNSDYPVEALAAKQEGVATVRYLIDTKGRTSRCSVTSSSGSAVLDAKTCAIVEQRFRYQPATGTNGKAADEWRTQRIAWRLPDLAALSDPPATEPARAEFMLEIDTKGEVMSCRVRQSSGDAAWDDRQCRAIGQSQTFKPRIGPDGRAVNSLVLFRVR